MARLIRTLMFLALIFVARPAFAGGAGGTCPNGANYTNPANPTGSLVTLSSLGITSCYFVAANGSNTNTGTDESHPFQFAPGMNACSNNCSIGLLAPGIGIIFRGGDTYHFGNSGASPYAGVVTTCADNENNAGGFCWDDINGTSSHPIIATVDPAWYTGGSWTRPIFTADNSLCNSGTTGTMPDGATCTYNASNACSPSSGSACTGIYYVSSCVYQVGNSNNLVDFGFSEYLWLDNIELTGLCQSHVGQPSSFDAYMQYASINDPVILTNLYIHGGSHTMWAAPNGQPACSPSVSCVNLEPFFGGPTTSGAPADSDFFNVVDFSDSDPIQLGSFLGGYNFAYNVFRYMSGTAPSDLHTFHDNLFEYYYSNGHTNVVESADRGTVNAIYNNLFRHLESTTAEGAGDVFLWFGPVASTTTDYIFNNVMYDVGNGEYLNFAGTGLTSNQGNYVLFNNTWQTNYAQPIVRCSLVTSPATVLTTNNHYINDQTPYQTCGQLTATTELAMTNATATANGYTSSQTYAYSPMLGSSPTVGVGKNENASNGAFCSGLSSAGLSDAASACQSDTSYACAYSTSAHAVSCPARTVYARQSTGAWNIGAYEYNAQDPPPPTPPSGLKAVVN